MSPHVAYFEQLFADNEDPWAFRTRWYEKRKRELLLATLQRQRYGRVFEPACANAEFSAALAERCDTLVCCDISHRAVELARQRLQHSPSASVYQGGIPDDWPTGHFDLIVLGEVGYYLDEAALRQVIQRASDSLSEHGALLACHWLPAIEGCGLDGRQVHGLIDRHLGLQRSVRHEENDFLLELWSRDAGHANLEEDIQ